VLVSFVPERLIVAVCDEPLQVNVAIAGLIPAGNVEKFVISTGPTEATDKVHSSLAITEMVKFCGAGTANPRPE